MTKRRRKKIYKIMYVDPGKYIDKGKYIYLHNQTKLYRKHICYLHKMNNRSFKKYIKQITEKYMEAEDA